MEIMGRLDQDFRVIGIWEIKSEGEKEVAFLLIDNIIDISTVINTL